MSLGIVEHIRSQLSLLPSSRVKIGRNYSYVACPFHAEVTPSCIVRHDPSAVKTGRYKCYGCSAHGPWNVLAEQLGLEAHEDSDYTVDNKIPKFRSEVYDLHLLGDEDEKEKKKELTYKFYSLSDEVAVAKAGIKNDNWRGYSLEFLRKRIKASLVYVVEYRRYYVHLPVSIDGVEKGYIHAQINKDPSGKGRTYINKPGVWSLQYGLFPFDPAVRLMQRKGLSTMVLVEGPRDALRFIRAGIPAVAILGTHSWSNTKSSTLENAGVTKIIDIFDGDNAGKIAHNLIVKGITQSGNPTNDFFALNMMFNVHSVKLWNAKIPEGHSEDKLDPGNMPDSMLNSVKKLLV